MAAFDWIPGRGARQARHGLRTRDAGAARLVPNPPRGWVFESAWVILGTLTHPHAQAVLSGPLKRSLAL